MTENPKARWIRYWLIEKEITDFNYSLHLLGIENTDDNMLQEKLSRLLEDRRIIKSGFGVFYYEEARSIAAWALASELATNGQYEGVELKNTFGPLTQEEILEIARGTTLSIEGMTCEQILEALLTANLIPLKDLTLRAYGRRFDEA